MVGYWDCPHYKGGYCDLAKNAFGINETCGERNDCPQFVATIDREKIWEKLRKKRTK